VAGYLTDEAADAEKLDLGGGWPRVELVPLALRSERLQVETGDCKHRYRGVHGEIQAYCPVESEVFGYQGGLARRLRKESEDGRVDVDGREGEKERDGAKIGRWRTRVTSWVEVKAEVLVAGGEAVRREFGQKLCPTSRI
jgi:hypothetical protein